MYRQFRQEYWKTIDGFCPLLDMFCRGTLAELIHSCCSDGERSSMEGLLGTSGMGTMTSHSDWRRGTAIMKGRMGIGEYCTQILQNFISYSSSVRRRRRPQPPPM